MSEDIVLELEKKIKEIIDELKGICNTNGLSNGAAEEVVITSVFLYKFLNDKFMYNLKQFGQDVDMSVEEILEEDMLDAFYDTYTQDVAFGYDDTIESLLKYIGNNDFYKTFDDALERISHNVKNDSFKVTTAGGEKQELFTRITENVESSKRNNFAKNIFAVISKDKFDFGSAFDHNFDFYSTIFEYLIKDYNVASGTYAEYFTPQVIASLIAKILVKMSPIDEDALYEINDPSAGSGSLILHLANELGSGKFGNRARVYTQDISNKSSRFLRINMLLNGLTESLHNIINGDTLETPAHYAIEKDPNSGIRKYSFITSNPPFKTDFSAIRDSIEQKWNATDRFFGGVPKIPAKEKKKMPIYLCFIQHILWTLKDDGKAAIVVPTGFITAQSGIEKKIREKIIENKWLKGVISMPSNIFANTGTNVSILFIDKANKLDDLILVDASKLGKKVKDGNNQKTVLSKEEVNVIIETFISHENVEDFSVVVTNEAVEEKNYSFSAGQYFEIKIDYIDITPEEFENKINDYTNQLKELFTEGDKLKTSIIEQLSKVKYE